MDIVLKDIQKTYRTVDGPVVKGVTYSFNSGSFTALMGRSGSGKSTLLNIMSGIVTPTAGEVLYGDTNLFDLSDKKRSNLRATRTATIFQDYNLLDFLTAEENIILGQQISGRKEGAMSPKKALSLVGLSEFDKKQPKELSGGQCQRISIARAISTKPDIVFADEPTGALDEENSRIVIALLQDMARSGISVIMVTHDPYIASAADTVLELQDGKIANKLDDPSVMDILNMLGSGIGRDGEGAQ